MAYTTGPDINTPPSSHCVYITANGQPSGGAFAWSTLDSRITIQNSTNQTAQICSVSGAFSNAVGDIAKAVIYTVNAVPTSSSNTSITISKPQTLIISSDNVSPTGHTCIQGVGSTSPSQSYYNDAVIGARYMSYLKSRTYSVKDNLGETVALSMSFFESYSPARQVSIGTGVGTVATDYFFIALKFVDKAVLNR